MTNYNYFAHSDMTFGRDAAARLPELLLKHKARTAMMIYDQGVKVTGIADRILSELEKANVKVVHYDRVQPNPTDVSVEEAAVIAKEHQADIFIAVGGGSSMDLAKAVNVLMTNPSPIGQYGGVGRVVHPGRPLIAIPTTAGTSSEITNVAALTDTVKICKYVIIDNKITPSDVLVDPEFTRSMPPALTAATGMDAITHAVESYISVMATPMTEYQSLEALRLFCENLPRAYENGDDMEAREGMMLGCVIAGYAFSNANLGLVHGIAHVLSAHFHLPHGMANAAVLPYVLDFNADSCPQKMIKLAGSIGLSLTGDVQLDCRVFPKAMLDMTRELGIKSLSQQGIAEADIEFLAEEVLKEPVLNFNPKQSISKEDVLHILRQAL